MKGASPTIDKHFSVTEKNHKNLKERGMYFYEHSGKQTQTKA